MTHYNKTLKLWTVSWIGLNSFLPLIRLPVCSFFFPSRLLVVSFLDFSHEGSHGDQICVATARTALCLCSQYLIYAHTCLQWDGERGVLICMSHGHSALLLPIKMHLMRPALPPRAHILVTVAAGSPNSALNINERAPTLASEAVLVEGE